MHPPDPSLSHVVPLRILVVDDNDDVAEMTAEMLKMYGHDATTAADGPSALAAVERDRPDVVLLDLGLPGMHGLEVAQVLHASAERAAPMLIAVSGYGRPEDRERSRNAGCEHHLVKPVDFDRLLALLATRSPSLH
ncbi:MAG: response regulator [Myxococcaceae bacterium]|nr:MAG: response regulator [Myxococcaceae bacterium]